MSDDTKYFDTPLSAINVARRMEVFKQLTDDAKCTCRGCANEFTCLYTYDSYNTSDDCLADK